MDTVSQDIIERLFNLEVRVYDIEVRIAGKLASKIEIDRLLFELKSIRDEQNQLGKMLTDLKTDT